jgi:hypothetical protein
MEANKNYQVSDAASEEMILSILMNGKRQEVDYVFEQDGTVVYRLVDCK